MLLLTFDTWTDFRARAITLVTPDMYYVEGDGFFKCSVMTPSGAGLHFSSDAKPSGLTGFAASFPTATKASGLSWTGA